MPCPQDLEIARTRMSKAGRAPEGKPYTPQVILGYLTSWKTLLFTLIFSKYKVLHIVGIEDGIANVYYYCSNATLRKPTFHRLRLLAQSP